MNSYSILEGVHAFGRSQCCEENVYCYKYAQATQTILKTRVYNLPLGVNIRLSEVEKFP